MASRRVVGSMKGKRQIKAPRTSEDSESNMFLGHRDTEGSNQSVLEKHGSPVCGGQNQQGSRTLGKVTCQKTRRVCGREKLPKSTGGEGIRGEKAR